MNESHTPTASANGSPETAPHRDLDVRREDRLERYPEIGVVGAGDAVYGLPLSAAVGRLTAENWRVSILTGVDDAGWLILYLQPQALRGEQGERLEGYLVLARGPRGMVPGYKRRFLKLDDALAYANGEDGGKIARDTHPAGAEQLPSRQPLTCRIILGAR